MRIEYHRTLIADRIRNEAFFAALKKLIVPGETVVADIGAGTGLLGLMASKLGAKDVYLFETAEVAGVAAKILKANKAKNCHLIPCHSAEFQDKLQADIVVSETLGNYALEENIIDTLNDARQRLLKKGGAIIPQALTQFIAPVVSPRIHEELCAWDGAAPGANFDIAKHMSFNNIYVRTLPASGLLADGKSAKIWDKIDLCQPNRSSRKGDAAWTVQTSSTVFGFAYWWSADLGCGISLSTAPDAPRTHWEQLYFPLLTPVKLSRGHSLSLALRSRSSEREGTHLAWIATHHGAERQLLLRQSHDLDQGYLP